MLVNFDTTNTSKNAEQVEIVRDPSEVDFETNTFRLSCVKPVSQTSLGGSANVISLQGKVYTSHER